MKRMMLVLSCAVAALCVLTYAHAARAQSEDKIYPWETLARGWGEVRAFGSMVAESAAPYERFGGAPSRQGLQQHYLELDYGVTDRWEAGVYTDFERSPDGPFRYSGVRLESNYRFFDRYQRLLEIGLHAELFLPRASSGGPEELELLGILQRDFGDFRLVVNPGFEAPFTGDEAKQGLNGVVNAGLYWRRFWVLQPAVEYFGNIGPISHPPPLHHQRHIIYPAVRVRIIGGMDLLLAVGFGLDRQSDRVTLRAVFTYEFETLRPATQIY